MLAKSTKCFQKVRQEQSILPEETGEVNSKGPEESCQKEAAARYKKEGGAGVMTGPQEQRLETLNGPSRSERAKELGVAGLGGAMEKVRAVFQLI